MQSQLLQILCLIAMASIPSTLTHGVITVVEGENGKMGSGFGMVATVPRTGTNRRPFQVDTAIIRDREIAGGKASSCGRTLAGGMIDITAEMSAAEAAGIPNMGADGKVSMTIHQINGDGAGPYLCEVDPGATGSSFMPVMVATNVPGKNSRSRAKTTAFPLVAMVPPSVKCTGGADGTTCLIRCRNEANAGPFGGCVVVTQAQ